MQKSDSATRERTLLPPEEGTLTMSMQRDFKCNNKSTSVFLSPTALAALAHPTLLRREGRQMFLGPKDQCLSLIQTLK